MMLKGCWMKSNEGERQKSVDIPTKDPQRKYSNQKTPKEKNVNIYIIDNRMGHLPLSVPPPPLLFP